MENENILYWYKAERHINGMGIYYQWSKIIANGMPLKKVIYIGGVNYKLAYEKIIWK